VQEQVAKGIHLQQNCMISQPTLRLLEKMDEITPDGIGRFFFNCACTVIQRSLFRMGPSGTRLSRTPRGSDAPATPHTHTIPPPTRSADLE
jgi:hypothetical protein